MSASGVWLMPCRLAKARRLLALGKAVAKRSVDGGLYLQLRFDPQSPVVQQRVVEGFSREFLLGVKARAVRRRVWFGLDGVERAVLDAAIRCAGRLRSSSVVDAVARVVVKVKRALMSPLYRVMEEVGRPLARKLSMLAQGWGYRAARVWAEDAGFIRYLAVMSGAFQRGR